MCASFSRAVGELMVSWSQFSRLWREFWVVTQSLPVHFASCCLPTSRTSHSWKTSDTLVKGFSLHRDFCSYDMIGWHHFWKHLMENHTPLHFIHIQNRASVGFWLSCKIWGWAGWIYRRLWGGWWRRFQNKRQKKGCSCVLPLRVV